MSVTLSICIATLNRAAFIGATLESIVSQATDEVEIVIVDGASTDNTGEVVRQYQQRFPRLRYLRLPVKGGVDQDYCKAVDLAQGQYCWLLTDDDLLKPGAIQTVLEATRHDYGLIIVNAEVRTADLSKIVETRRLPFNTDRVYKPPDSQRLFVETAPYLSFIGGVVIKRQLWEQREKEKYFGTVFVHVGVIFQSPLPADTLAIAEPWTVIRYGNAQWTARWFEIWMFKWPNLIWSFSDYPDSAKSQVESREPWRRLRVLLLLRAKGVYSMKEYHAWIEPRLNPGWRKFAARLVVETPGCVVNSLAILYYSILKSPLNLFDLRNSRFYYRRSFNRIRGGAT
jgi:abequosyltransferase